jgi:hypothetical protein
VREHEPDDMDVGAARETEYDDIGHDKTSSLDDQVSKGRNYIADKASFL